MNTVLIIYYSIMQMVKGKTAGMSGTNWSPHAHSAQGPLRHKASGHRAVTTPVVSST